MTILAIEFW